MPRVSRNEIGGEMDVNLHDLSTIVNKSGGYLSVDRRSGDLQTKGSSFFGSLVVWIRFKTSASFRNAVTDARHKVMVSMLSDRVYGDDFRKKIESLDKRNGLFSANKPLSARKVRRFINDVTQGIRQETRHSTDQTPRRQSGDEESRVSMVNWMCGKGDTITSRETFDDHLHIMLAEKLRAERGIQVAELDLKSISDEVNQTALDDAEGMATVSSGAQAKAHIGKAMSRVLDRRIANLRSQTRAKLRDRLSVSGLPEEHKRKVNVEIGSSKIATMDELDRYVNELVLQQMDEEFAALVEGARTKHNFHDELAQLPEVKKQLTEQLLRQNEDRMLSLEVVRDKAEQLLNRWMADKQEALRACRESPYAGVADLLTKLTLREPGISKAHILSFKHAVERSMDDIYAKDRAVYEALNVDKAKLFAMLSQFDRRGVLLNRLQRLTREAQGASALFGSEAPPVPDAEAVTRRYIESLSKPMVKSYAEVSALRGKIPQPMYQTMMEKVSKGYVWEPKFISAANGLHINSLVEKDNQGLYELLDSPQVGRKKIGSKEDFVSFSLDDLLRSMLGPKNVANPKKRRQAIDQVIPREVKIRLLNDLDKQLQMVRSRVMNEADADALFERGTVRFLRAQKIDFEAMTAK